MKNLLFSFLFDPLVSLLSPFLNLKKRVLVDLAVSLHRAIVGLMCKNESEIIPDPCSSFAGVDTLFLPLFKVKSVSLRMEYTSTPVQTSWLDAIAPTAVATS